jgi:hypothetical protein
MMATNVSLVVLPTTSSRFVLATVPEINALMRLWRKPQADAALETWDFDLDFGTLVATSETDLGAESLEVPLASLTRLRFAAVKATPLDDYCEYELQLSYEDGSPLGSMVKLPSTSRYRARRPNEVRSALARLRAFLKPSCPKLEGTVLEELGKWFTMGHQKRLQHMQETFGKVQSALEAISQGPQAPGMDVANWKDKLQGYETETGSVGG